MMKGWQIKSLETLIEDGVVELTRGKVISKKDLKAHPGEYPVYSSARENDGMFGKYGKYMFDEELITWSVDGGGRLFHRSKHKFSVTNVGGVLRIRDTNILDYRFLYFVLTFLHSQVTFDWVKKAHPSIIKKIYQNIPVPPLAEQQRIAALLDETFAALNTVYANAEWNRVNARELFEAALEDVFANGRNKGWKEKNLGDMFDIKHGFAFKGEYFSDKGKYVVLTPGNFYEEGGYRDRKEKTKYYKGEIPRDYILNEGNLLIAMTEQAAGLLGSPIIVPESDKFLHNQRLGLIQYKNDNEIATKFLFHLFNTKLVRQLIHDSARVTLP